MDISSSSNTHIGETVVRICIVAILVVLCLLFVPFSVQSQETESLSPNDVDASIEEGAFSSGTLTEPAGNVSCFDYYTFGSVQADITTAVSQTVSGAPIAFSGFLRNNNPYPVVDGSLYVKIFRLRESSTEKNVNGPHVVDQFFVQDGIHIPADGSVPTQFAWNVPAHAHSGDYQLATFFTTAKKYNLLGLSFTDDVVGNTVNFKVIGERTDGVVFNKDTVTLNGEQHRFAAFPLRFGDTEPVTASVMLGNTTGQNADVKVRWRLYHWDALRHENLLRDETQGASIVAGGAEILTFTVEDTRYPVYLLVAEAEWKDTTSLLNIRFVREDIARGRINYPAVTAYPLQKGQEVTLFSCLHSTSATDVENAQLILQVLDQNNDEIHRYEYDGLVTGAMMGVADTFVPKQDHSTFTIQTYLFQDGQVVDEERISYICGQLGAQCLNLTEAVNFTQWLQDQTADITTQWYVIIGLVILLMVVGIVAIIFRLTRRVPDTSNTDTI